MLPWVILGVVALPVGAYYFSRPALMRVSRSVPIEKPPSAVFGVLKDFRQWNEWSPWFKLEPTATCNIEGDGQSAGASLTWDGQLIGAGTLTLRGFDATAGRLEYDLLFTRPFKSTAQVVFTIAAAGSGASTVTWQMESKMPYILHKMMKAMIGMDYERGLSMLKEYVETGTVLSQTHIEGVQERPGLYYVGLERQSGFDELGASMEEGFHRLMQSMERSKVEPTGQPFTIYNKYDFIRRSCHYVSAVPVATGDLPELYDGLFVSSIPTQQALVIRHLGRYEHLGNPWAAAHMWLRANKRKLLKFPKPYEFYTNDPEKTATADLETVISLPLK